MSPDDEFLRRYIAGASSIKEMEMGPGEFASAMKSLNKIGLVSLIMENGEAIWAPTSLLRKLKSQYSVNNKPLN